MEWTKSATLYIKIILIFTLILAVSYILYASFGWFDGDMEQHLIEHYQPEGKTIASAKYMCAGGDFSGGYLIYKVRTEDEAIYYVRVHVKWRRSVLGTVGPGYKIKGYSIVNPEDYELVAKISFYTEPVKEHSKPEVADFVVLTAEQNLELERILKSIESWQDDHLTDRLPFWFDGEFEFDYKQYYFAYQDRIVYCGHHYTQISGEDMEWIRGLNPKE